METDKEMSREEFAQLILKETEEAITCFESTGDRSKLKEWCYNWRFLDSKRIDALLYFIKK